MFTPTKLRVALTVERVVTIHYFEYTRDYIFQGESHDFWELVYVDKGEVGVVAGEERHTLRSGEMIFHKPSEFHNIRANGVFANVAIITFYCDSKAMRFFENRRVVLDKTQRHLLSMIIKEGKNAFAEPLNLPFQTQMRRRSRPPFGCEQLIRLYLEQLLISFIRSDRDIAHRDIALRDTAHREAPGAKEDSEDRIVESVAAFLADHVYETLTLDEVCEGLCFSRSYIKKLFSRRMGEGIMERFTALKIDEAKRLISLGEKSVTEISELLGYGSIHYFSRLFKNKTGMSPREYAKSVRKNALL